MSNYTLSTFLRVPTSTDNRLKIYDKYLNLKYTLDPNITYYYSNGNIAHINVGTDSEIMIDFPTSNECNLALVELNKAKEYLISILPPVTENSHPLKSVVFSSTNLNMICKNTSIDGDLACDDFINSRPIMKSQVKVFINGVEVNVGGKVYPFDCYFSYDNGNTIRLSGDERIGDKLYWNNSISGYNLDTTDLIDFVYLTEINL